MVREWAVAISHPGCEHKAVWHSTKRGFECWFPRDRGKDRLVALFPSYFFVVASDAWRKLMTTPYVRGVITTGEKPCTLPDDVIKNIRERCDDNGIFIREKYRKNQKLMVHKGPLAGHICIYQGMRSQDRVRVLMDLLGAQVRTDVRECDLAAAD